MLLDLSHVVEHGMVTYKGLPAPIVCDFLTRKASRSLYAEGTEFHIGKIEMVANTGTYLDSPFHRYANGKDLSELELDRLANLETVVLRVPTLTKQIGPEFFQKHNVAGKAVLINTGWSRHWRTDEYFENHPFLTGSAAQWLCDAGAMLVGIDSLNIDNIKDGTRPVHSLLLASGIPIVEHLRGLEQLPDEGAKFFALPVKVRNFGTFPVRAIGIVS